MPALVLTTDGEVKPAPVPASDTLHWLYEQISCSLVDVVRLSKDLDMWIDDEGLINESPVNILATLWARWFGGLDVIIHGNAVLAKNDGQGNTVELGAQEVYAFMSTMEKILDLALTALPPESVQICLN